MAVALLLGLLEEKTGWLSRIGERSAWTYAGATAFLLIGLELFGVTEEAIPFIYFQF